MSSSGKLVLCLAVVFCAMQMISARPRIDETFLENVKFDLKKKCTGVENDMSKEMSNGLHKLAKESTKLFKKARTEKSKECIESAKLQAQEEMEEKGQDAEECVQKIRDSIEQTLSSEASVNDILSFRQETKNQLQICKKTGKADMKMVQNQFSITGKQCLV